MARNRQPRTIADDIAARTSALTREPDPAKRAAICRALARLWYRWPGPLADDGLRASCEARAVYFENLGGGK